MCPSLVSSLPGCVSVLFVPSLMLQQPLVVCLGTLRGSG